MSDPFSTLLHDEASLIAVPPIPPDLLAGGRREVRRRRTRTAVIGAVAAVLAVVGATVAVDHWTGADDSIQPADRVAYERDGAWVSDGTVHIGNRTVSVPDVAWGVAYTAAGAIVGSLETGAVDSSMMLVTPEGRVHNLGPLGQVGADPASTEIVFARAVGERTWQLVTWDLTTNDQQPLGEPFESESSPSLALSGQYVVFLRGQRMMMMDRETGEVARLPQQELTITTFQSFGPTGYLTAALTGGSARVREWHLRTLPEGEPVGTFPDAGDQYASLSPDGRYLITRGDDRSVVYDVATGTALPLDLPGRPDATGWTPDGHVITTRDDSDTLLICQPTTGRCSDTGESPGDALWLATGAYSSWSTQAGP